MLYEIHVYVFSLQNVYVVMDTEYYNSLMFKLLILYREND